MLSSVSTCAQFMIQKPIEALSNTVSVKLSSMTKQPVKKPAVESVPQKEAEERRDAILKRMLNTPPKPKKGKGGTKKGGSKSNG